MTPPSPLLLPCIKGTVSHASHARDWNRCSTHTQSSKRRRTTRLAMIPHWCVVCLCESLHFGLFPFSFQNTTRNSQSGLYLIKTLYGTPPRPEWCVHGLQMRWFTWWLRRMKQCASWPGARHWICNSKIYSFCVLVPCCQNSNRKKMFVS